jgi:hypothetical protein
MSDCYTTFCSRIRNITTEEHKWLARFVENICDRLSLAELAQWEKEREIEEGDIWPDFEFDFVVEDGKTHFEAYSEESGSVNQVSIMFQRFLQEFRPNDCLCINWAGTDSRPDVDSDGGGAAFITAKRIQGINTGSWLYNKEKAWKAKQKSKRSATRLLPGRARLRRPKAS